MFESLVAAVDQLPASLATAPLNIVFEPGRIAITFSWMEELVGSLMVLTEILDDADQFTVFEGRYVPRRLRSAEQDETRTEIARLFRELEDMKLTNAEHSVLEG